jgi:Haem-NO-binding
MHGTILVLLKRFVTHQYDFATWHRLIELAGLTEADFETKRLYPDDHMYQLVGAAAAHVGIPAEVLQEKFGEFLVPDLLFMYRKLIQPEWRTLDFLEHTEHTLHGAVRRDMTGSSPPVLDVERLSPDKVRVRYVSNRRMGALAVGIIRGIAHYYGEENELRIQPLSREDGGSVEILIERIERPATTRLSGQQA